MLVMRCSNDFDRRGGGFALPTVLILSMVLLVTLLASVAAMSAARQALTTQQYERMAKLAAESGIAYASACMSRNDFMATWTDDSPLTPGSDCRGVTSCATNANRCLVVDTDNYTSSFRVKAPTGGGTGVQYVDAVGVVTLKRNNGTPWRTYETMVQARTGGSILVDGIAFGYADAGTFFFTTGRDGYVRGVGANGVAQLGVGNRSTTYVPKIVSLPPGVYASQTIPNPVATNFLNSGFAAGIVSGDGDAYFSGANDRGQLGMYGPSSNTFTKFPLPGWSNDSKPTGSAIAAIPVFYNNFVITDRGYVFVAGQCEGGQAGVGWSGGSCSVVPPRQLIGLPSPNLSKPSTVPINVTGDDRVRHLLMKDGSVYGWGYDGDIGNNYMSGALGIGDSGGRMSHTPKPIRIDGQVNCSTTGSSNCPFGAGDKPCVLGDTSTVHCVVDVQETGRATYLLANDGTVWSSGSDWGIGLLGQGTTNGSTGVFKQITDFPSDGYSHRAVAIHADAFSLSILTNDPGNPSRSAVYTVGRNNSGLAGCGQPIVNSDGGSEIGCPEKITRPVRFKLPSGVYPVDMYNTSNMTRVVGPMGNNIYNFTDNLYVIASDKKIYGAGDNTYGQLGDKCAMSSSGPSAQCTTASNGQPASRVGTPVVMSVLDGSSPARTARSIQAGRGTAVIKTQSGIVYAVGLNDAGQLGDGTNANSSTPRANKYLNLSSILYY